MFKALFKLVGIGSEKTFRDPVCGMKIKDGIPFERNGRKLLFCSEHCKKTYVDGLKKVSDAPTCH